MPKMLLEEEVEDLEEMIQMINKDKNRPEKKLTDNSWLGQELVNNILEMSFNFKCQTEIKDFMVLRLRVTA
jgi:hypothetical protein